MTIDKSLIPEKLRPIVALGFSFDTTRVVAREAYGDCLFCGGKNKLYANMDTAQWECKSCSKKGNVYTYITEWYKLYQEKNKDNSRVWKKLANDRQIAPDILLEAGIVFDGMRYAVPTLNTQDHIVNLAFYKISPAGIKTRMMNLAGIETALWGVHLLSQRKQVNRIFICEGFWDGIALRDFLGKEGEEGVVLVVPGAGVWKQSWNQYITGKDIIFCYDNGSAGAKGKARAYREIKTGARSIQHIDWPTGLPDGYDIRDYYQTECSFQDLMELVTPYLPDDVREEGKATTELLPISSSSRPRFSEVVSVYQKHLHMTPDFIDALKLSFAVVLTTNIPGPPNWLHIVGPPGSGKTLIVTSLQDCSTCYFVSTLTPRSLISGYAYGKGEDPSLLPKVDGKTLIVKDFTEVLAMPKINKDELFGTLRGAYDGFASKPFGNRGTVSYQSHFNMLTGVTQQVYAERSASLGERFLMFHMIKGVTFEAKDAIRSAIKNVGKEVLIKEDLVQAAKEFLEVSVNEEDTPKIPERYITKMIALAELVAVLRASVERDLRTGNMLLRPQQEMGTRLAVQFSKLLMGLGLINTPASIGAEEYRLLVRVAVDSMVGFNLEAVASLMDNPGQTADELAENCGIPKPTLRSHLSDLIELQVIYHQKVGSASAGRPMHRYALTRHVALLWKEAGLERINGQVQAIAIEKRQAKVRLIKRKAKRK